MDEVWVRAALVVGATLLVVFVSWLVRRRPAGRSLNHTGLRPGVYLFTSRTCGDCDGARLRLGGRLGAGGFTEVEWEMEPELFNELAIDRVPSTLVVSPDGRGVWAEGTPADLDNP
jgi:hypothetical protein